MVTRYGLLKLHDELVDALDLDGAPRECDPLLEALNDAYNMGARSRDAEVDRLQRELAEVRMGVTVEQAIEAVRDELAVAWDQGHSSAPEEENPYRMLRRKA